MSTRIRKAQVFAARQCPRRAWLEWRRPELAAPADMALPQWDLPAVARAARPKGVRIAGPDPVAATAAALANGPAVLFDPVFEHGGLRVRLDVLEGDSLLEVRSGTRVRQRHLEEAALKLWVAERAGLHLTAVRIACVNRAFVYAGNGDYQGLLSDYDVTADVRALVSEVPGWVAQLQSARGEVEPEVLPGRQCNRPAPCPFLARCRLPSPEYPVSDLRANPALVRSLREDGYDDLREVPARRLQKPLHRRIHRAVVSGEAQLEPELVAFARQLDYPRHYLDFEAVQFALPIWPGTQPYQSLPFQWSCHIEQDGEAVSTEQHFLDLGGGAPMRACAESLVAAVGGAGPVLVYGEFEAAMLNQLTRWAPELKAELRAIRARLVDLLPWVQRHYYHRDMHGAWSLKVVLPTLAPTRELPGQVLVREGLGAQLAYLEAIAEATPAARREQLSQALTEYCSRDARALLEMVRFFAAGGHQGGEA